MYFANIDDKNNVIQVIVADDNFVKNMPGTWIQTDPDGISPKNYAGIGHVWREDLNAFIPPKPFPSWKLNESECRWEAPVPMPEDGEFYFWDEEKLSWSK